MNTRNRDTSAALIRVCRNTWPSGSSQGLTGGSFPSCRPGLCRYCAHVHSMRTHGIASPERADCVFYVHTCVGVSGRPPAVSRLCQYCPADPHRIAFSLLSLPLPYLRSACLRSILGPLQVHSLDAIQSLTVVTLSRPLFTHLAGGLARSIETLPNRFPMPW